MLSARLSTDCSVTCSYLYNLTKSSDLRVELQGKGFGKPSEQPKKVPSDQSFCPCAPPADSVQRVRWHTFV